MALHVEKWRYDKIKLKNPSVEQHYWSAIPLLRYSTILPPKVVVSTTDDKKISLSPLNVYFITTFQAQQSGFYNNNINAPLPTNGIFSELGSF